MVEIFLRKLLLLTALVLRGDYRLAQLLIERVVIADSGLEIIWRDQGWQELAVELLHGTIGAELQEMEEAV